jgi:SRSO17 transposase
MTPYILKRWPRFDNFVALFTTKLAKPAQRHLVALLIGLIIYDGRKNLAGLNRALFAPCHASSLQRFIGEASWDEHQFEQIRLGELNRRVRRYLQAHRAKGQSVPAFLCIDDTNNPKTGGHTPWASYQYSHLAGGLVRCYCLVTAVLVIGPYAIPLSFQLYRKKADCLKAGRRQLYLSKTALAARLIEQWQVPDGTQPFVLLDSWYVCDDIFEVCAKRHFTLIGGLKANRQLTTTACPKLTSLSEFSPILPKTAYQLVTLEKRSFRVAGVTAQLKGGQSVKIVVSRAFAQKMKAGAGIRAYTYRYFVCSDPALSVATICEFYAVRWEIETFHALAKELLGLDHNQCWREGNVVRLWRLVLIAYTYLVLEAVEQSAEYAKVGEQRVSLGQVVAQHKREAHRAQAEWVYAQARAGQSLEAILDQIAA